MRILITGASGFIGREFVNKYQHIYEISVLVRKNSDISLLKNMKCKIINFDQNKEIIEIFKNENYQGVVHFASSIVIEHKNDELEELINSNIIFGTYLLEASKNTDVKWFINTGTYWQNYKNEKYNPVNLYAATKEALNVIAKYYTETSDIIFTTIKLNIIFGEHDTRPKIFNLLDKISKTGEVLDMSKGEQIIDITYIDDALLAYEILIGHLMSSNKDSFKNKTFAVKSNERLSLKELTKAFQNISNRELNINWGKKKYREREMMIAWEGTNVVPGWIPRYNIKEMIEKNKKTDEFE